MALITCPECGAQVSDAANACPKCGFPIANIAAAQVATAPAESMVAAEALTEPALLPTERSAEPLRFMGRRIPIAALLFWGGMTLGVVLSMFKGEDGSTPLRYIPYTMIFAGMLWFSVTELSLLLKHRKRRY
jgi:hypothetical protein